MTACAMCGQCCAAIGIAHTKKDIREKVQIGKEDEAFVLVHWHRISRATAEERVPGIVGGQKAFYECDQYDPATKLCLAHDTRPPICRNFPWYGRPPSEVPRAIEPWKRCSFWHDLPRAQWPAGIDPLPSPPEVDAL